MKIKTIVFIILCVPLFGKAQTNSFPTNGNVGIGTVTPLAGIGNNGMHIAKGDHSSILLGDPLGSGYGGIVQTSDTKHRVFIGANLYDDVNKGWSSFIVGKGGAGISIVADKGGWGSSISFYLSDNDRDVASKFIMRANGNVGIGIENPQAKLAVDGNILAKEIKVKTDITVPDYVFEPEYDLKNLEEIESYVKANKHLPEVPSAKEIGRDGLDLGEMNLLLLKKIEELTLYAIEQNDQIKKQFNKSAQQEKVLQRQQEEIERIRKLSGFMEQRIKQLEHKK